MCFVSSEEMDLSLFGAVDAFFARNSFDYCINCAAYTNVERAEQEKEMAYLINAEAVKNLARICRAAGCILVHFSTDYVFDGLKGSPYLEDDEPNPLNVYGQSKLAGEDLVRQIMSDYYILRTSWLYSDLGRNFFNMVRSRAGSGEKLGITTAQVGTPTSADDLALFVLKILSEDIGHFGVYHYSNLGTATWYEFASEILGNMRQKALLYENNDFQTQAERPEYSVLSKEKTLSTFGIPIAHWQESMQQYF